MLEKLVNRENLTVDEAEYLMEGIINDIYSPEKTAALLTALRMKGETVDEITAFSRVMRRFCTGIAFTAGEPLLDTCGTGGDGCCTFNISTTVAFIASACGIKVAKHGNRAASSRCGSADLCEALGITIALSPEAAAESLEKTGFCFLFAREYHRAMSRIAPIRKELAIRTVFNLLGPLTNPAKATHQIIGLFSPRLLETIAHVVRGLGIQRAVVVHGDGTDEFTVTGPTHYTELRDGLVSSHTVGPEDFGLLPARKEALRGGDSHRNAEIVREIFSGKRGPRRDIVLLNAGAALYVAERAETIQEGVRLASRCIDDGRAAKKLDEIIEFSKGLRD